MQKQLNKQPFFLILIPIFFVLHGLKENFGFIDIGDAALLIASYLAIAVILFLLSYFFLKNKIKAAVFAAWVISIYLFYGAIQDFFKDHARVLAKYSVLLTFLCISLIVLFFYLKKTNRNFYKLTLYLNLIFIIYVAIDTISLTVKSINPPRNKFSIFPFSKANVYRISPETKKPDIYFLLFDEYGSSLSLKQQYNFDNDLDSFLVQKGFHLQEKSYSNYNATPVSMASILNMSYLEGLSGRATLTADDYSYCHELIKNNEVIKFLSTQGYNIVNFSIFDLVGNPSPISQTILPLKTRLITDNTLFSRMHRDMGWMLYHGPTAIRSLIIKRMLHTNVENNAVLDSLEKQSARTSLLPSFVYAHVYMPHDPFFFDKNGIARDNNTIIGERDKSKNLITGRNSKSYLEYVRYTNTRIKAIINSIQTNSKNNAVIILMGDHGFREHFTEDLHQNFQNMNAVYFPEKDYHLLYDSISAVNQFRVIFNTLFHQSFPLLNDSTIFVR